MFISLRAKLLVAFALTAGVMGVVTLLAITALREQTQLSVTADLRQDRIVDAMAVLRATPFEAEGLVLSHLSADTPGRKAYFAAELLGSDTREALALAELSATALGAERAVVADLRLQASRAVDLRERLVAISARNAGGEARVLATREMPGLRAELISALRIVAAQTGAALPAARAEAALNAIAAAEKNALLTTDEAYVTGQLAAAALARAEYTAALAELQGFPAPGWPSVTRLTAALNRLEARMEVLLRDGGAETAAAIYENQLRPLDQARLHSLAALGDLLQTGRRAVDQSALAAVADWQATLVLLADLALVLGFSAVVVALGKIGRGLEAAVRLAERMAQSELSPPTWVQRNLSGRLTAALVQISAGQTAVLASLEALAAGRPLRGDLPDRMREKFALLAARMSPDATQLAEGVARARLAVEDLQVTLQAALRDGQTIRDGAEALVDALETPQGPLPAAEAAARHALITERHLATLILAEREGEALALGLGAEGEGAPAPRPAVEKSWPQGFGDTIEAQAEASNPAEDHPPALRFA